MNSSGNTDDLRFDMFVGMDLGHGDTCLIRRVPKEGGDALEEPVAVDSAADDQGPSFPTILARQGGYPMIGRHAEQSSAESIATGFKCRPTTSPAWPENRGRIVEFVRAVHRGASPYLRTEDAARQLWVVGYPSGWSDEDARSYRQAFLEAGLPNVRIERESRAAMIFARDEGLITPERLRGAGLVCDIGSLTTDSTFIEAMHAVPREFAGGDRLGAGLIERQMLAMMRRLPAFRRLEEYLAENPGRTGNAAFACRRLKEKYFRANPDLRDRGVSYKFETADSDFALRADRSFMGAVLDAPIAALGGRSWKASYRTYLERVRAELKGTPDFLVLTGGGSRMDFTREIAAEIFRGVSGTSVPLSLDKGPETTVARGLARIAHWDRNCREFTPMIEALLDAKKIARWIAPKFRGAQIHYLQATCERFFGSWAGQCIDDWRAGKVKGKDGLYEAVNAKAKAWEKGEDARRVRMAVAKPFSDAVLKGLAPEVGKVCSQFGIPEGKALHFTLDFDDASFNTAMGEIFDNVVGRGFSRFAGWFVDQFWILPKSTDWLTKAAVKMLGNLYSLQFGAAGWFVGEAENPGSPAAIAAARAIREQLLGQMNAQLATVQLWIR